MIVAVLCNSRRRVLQAVMPHIDQSKVDFGTFPGLLDPDLPPGEGMHLLSRCSGSRLVTPVVLVRRTSPFSRDRARPPGLPSPLPSRLARGRRAGVTRSRGLPTVSTLVKDAEALSGSAPDGVVFGHPLLTCRHWPGQVRCRQTACELHGKYTHYSCMFSLPEAIFRISARN